MVPPRIEDIDDAYDAIWATGLDPDDLEGTVDKAVKLSWPVKIACVYIFVALIPFLAIYGLLYLVASGRDNY